MNLNDGSGSSLEVRGAEATLLEVEPGVAVLLGDHVPAGLEVEPFGLGSHGDREIVHALSNAVGAANLAACQKIKMPASRRHSFGFIRKLLSASWPNVRMMLKDVSVSASTVLHPIANPSNCTTTKLRCRDDVSIFFAF